ncbi:MAG: HEAT repeat domain-containing protein [Chloroflexi bacterium]|nr:HEAT repeat domain-containing protein [Chloroflexota bacterium]
MHSTNPVPESHWEPPHSRSSSRRRLRIIEIGLSIAAIVLIGILVFSTSRAVSPGAITNVGDQSDFARFQDSAQRLLLIGSPEAFQILIQAFRQGEPITHRNVALQLLATASSPNAVPALMRALKDNDSSVRAGAAQVLGMRHEKSAIPDLIAATRDDKAQVRREAIRSLVQLDAWQVLPRIDQLLTYEIQDEVRQAAQAAKDAFRVQVAFDLGIPSPQVHDVVATPSEPLRYYAVTTTDLYARDGATWQRVSALPDAPNSIAAGSNQDLIYLATQNSGLYKSADGGKSWEHVQFGKKTPTQLTVTAVTIDPTNDQQIYIALATTEADGKTLSGMGVFSSSNGGKTFVWLEDSPMQVVTTRLTLDPNNPDVKGYLLGIADNTPWRYRLG